MGISGMTRSLPIWHDVPTACKMSAQWIVNVNTDFAFMRDVERMSLVNIGESQCGLGAVVYSSSIVMPLHNINIY